MRRCIRYTVGSIISHMGMLEKEHKPAHYEAGDCLSYGCKVLVFSDGSTICLEALMKIKVECHKNNESSALDLNPGPPKYMEKFC